jgi:hypothetical protein
VTSRHCPCDRYSNYLSRPLMLILPILIIILMLEQLPPTHSCDPTVLCGVGAGIQDFLHSDSFVLLRRLCDSFRSCASSRTPAISFVFVGWCSLFIRTSSSFLARHQISIVRLTGDQSGPFHFFRKYPLRGIQSVIFAPLRTSYRSVYQTGLLQQCIQPATSNVNIFCYLPLHIYHFQELLQCAQ